MLTCHILHYLPLIYVNDIFKKTVFFRFDSSNVCDNQQKNNNNYKKSYKIRENKYV